MSPAITDVPGVLVGHATVIADEPRVARTGVTMIVPRAGNTWEDRVFGGFFSFNGNGEMTGLPWLEESGMIDAAIGISKPQVEAKASISSERVTTGLHGLVFRKYLAPWQR